MTTNIYGARTREIINILEQMKTATPEQLENLANSESIPLKAFRGAMALAQTEDAAGNFLSAVENRNKARALLKAVEAWEEAVGAAVTVMQNSADVDVRRAAGQALGVVWGTVKDQAWTESVVDDSQKHIWAAEWDEANKPAIASANAAVTALSVYDLISLRGFTQAHYETLVAPWEYVFGKVDGEVIDRGTVRPTGYIDRTPPAPLRGYDRGPVRPTGYIDSMLWRDARAQELLGSYSVKTAGSFMISSKHQLLDGWIYANRENLLFLSNSSLVIAASMLPELIDDRTLLIKIAGRGAKVTAPFGVPSGIIDFGMGLEFAGAKKQIKAIGALCR